MSSMPKKTVLPAHQARSRESLQRLLKATVEILDEDGLEGTTIPRIAARAGVSPGTVYRRFPDKDALMREVCTRVLEGNYTQSKELFAAERWKDRPLGEIAQSVINLTLKGHRRHRGLVRALLFFTLQHPDEAFVRKSEELKWKVLRDISELLLTRRREIRHPNPESAVKFAITMVSFAAQSAIILPHNPAGLSRLVPNVGDQLERELSRMILRYLGVEDRD
jgi:AcrR family transcriptional regulator